MTPDKDKREQTTKIFIHEIKLDGNDEFSKRFNECSDSWAKSQDPQLTEQDRQAAKEQFMQHRICLEMGIG